MFQKRRIGIAGFSAGAVNGLFGAGGGMVLVPLLGAIGGLEEREIFPASISIILPMCLVTLLLSPGLEDFSWVSAIPYLLGSALGGLAAGLWGKHIPTRWLHKVLGALILWGGIRYLW